MGFFFRVFWFFSFYFVGWFGLVLEGFWGFLLFVFCLLAVVFLVWFFSSFFVLVWFLGGFAVVGFIWFFGFSVFWDIFFFAFHLSRRFRAILEYGALL